MDGLQPRWTKQRNLNRNHLKPNRELVDGSHPYHLCNRHSSQHCNFRSNQHFSPLDYTVNFFLTSIYWQICKKRLVNFSRKGGFKKRGSCGIHFVVREISPLALRFKSLQVHFSIHLVHFNYFFSGYLRFLKSITS